MKLARSLVRVGGLAAVLAVVGGLVWGVLYSPFLEIKTIEVRGPVEASGLQEVTRTVEEALSGNIFTADIGAVKRAVEGSPGLSRPTCLVCGLTHFILRSNGISRWRFGRTVVW